MNPKTEHADPSGLESESGAAQITPTEADRQALHEAWRAIQDGSFVKGSELIAQHTRAEVRKAVEPLVEALWDVAEYLDAIKEAANEIGERSACYDKVERIRSALSAHRARESQEGSRGSSGVSPSTELKP